jgi:hypothetical protein
MVLQTALSSLRSDVGGGILARMSRKRYEIVAYCRGAVRRAERKRSAEALASPSPQQAEADRSEHPAVPPVLAAEPVPDGDPPPGFKRLGSELIRIGRDDTKLASLFGRDRG